MGARPQHTLGYRKLCALLRAWREEAKLTQRHLATKLGKVPSYVHKVEVADRRIDPLEFVAWCRACERNPATCLTDLEKETGNYR